MRFYKMFICSFMRRLYVLLYNVYMFLYTTIICTFKPCLYTLLYDVYMRFYMMFICVRSQNHAGKTHFVYPREVSAVAVILATAADIDRNESRDISRPSLSKCIDFK